MRSRLTTQWGRRLIQKCRKWVGPLEVGVRVQRDMEDRGINYDITPPSKVQRPDAQCWLRARSLQVCVVEFGDELLGALYIADRAPFIFFNTIALPAY